MVRWGRPAANRRAGEAAAWGSQALGLRGGRRRWRRPKHPNLSRSTAAFLSHFFCIKLYFPPSHHSPDQTSMINLLPRVAQEGAGVAIAIANHPWFGRQGKPRQARQVKSSQGRWQEGFEAVCTQAHPGSQITLPALSPGWTHPSAKSVCKRRILQWCSPAYSNRNEMSALYKQSALTLSSL